ncbi:MAG: agmatine deiminase family protein [Bacteroidales bacterium]|nr:agmatine deiminase family protein [Bacteroidales bacterium]
MISKRIITVFVFVSYIFVSCSSNVEKKSTVIEPPVVKHHSNRVAAEWEPALGTIVVWPLDLPHKLIIELAKDAKLYTIVPNKEEIEIAKEWYIKWNIDLNNVEFIVSAQGLDSWWARDWGAFAVFDSLGVMRLADGQYKYSTPVTTIGCNDSLQFLFTEKDDISGAQKIVLTTDDDNTPLDIANYMGYERIDLPFTFTGGNVFMDGRGAALSTCVIKNENRYIGNSDEELVNDSKDFLGIEAYNFISNFEHSGIQHIDCYLKILDNNRLFVMQPPADHELYQIYEDIANNELTQLKNAQGEAYEIIRLSTARYKDDRLAAYSNSLIINKNIYVPLFGISQDSIALSQWKTAMPGYTVKGFYYDVFEEPKLHPRVLKRRVSGLGWKDGDALHCRTRAMWNPQMLYIAFAKQPTKSDNSITFEASIIDYSNSGLIRSEMKLMWREKGSSEWNTVQLEERDQVNYFVANIDYLGPNKKIEYYITAKTVAGKTQSAPMTAPIGFYTL